MIDISSNDIDANGSKFAFNAKTPSGNVIIKGISLYSSNINFLLYDYYVDNIIAWK